MGWWSAGSTCPQPRALPTPQMSSVLPRLNLICKSFKPNDSDTKLHMPLYRDHSWYLLIFSPPHWISSTTSLRVILRATSRRAQKFRDRQAPIKNILDTNCCLDVPEFSEHNIEVSKITHSPDQHWLGRWDRKVTAVGRVNHLAEARNVTWNLVLKNDD